MKANFFLT